MLSIDWTPLGPRNHVLDGVQIFPRKGTLLGATLGHAYTCSLVYFPVACCLGKLFTPIVPLFTKQQNLVAALLSILQAWRKVMAAYRRVYDSRHLQADCQ